MKDKIWSLFAICLLIVGVLSQSASAQSDALIVVQEQVVQVAPVQVVRATPVRTAVSAVSHAVAGLPANLQALVGRGLAQAKAEKQAQLGLRASHRVPGFPTCVASYEGSGWSTSSAYSAVTNCCYWGRRQPVDIGVARGRDGWYAIVGYR